MCAAISWAKKSFRKYFNSQENYELFHQFADRLLQAPTIPITRLLQNDIVLWLESAEESRAASWFSENWCGEKGNYTNATAGYVGNSMASGIESHWRYAKRDTIGTSGTNQRISLDVFAGSLVRYMKTTSERHADKILDEKTGRHIFPSKPTISTKMWKDVQKFDTNRLLFSFLEGSDAVRKKWNEALRVLCPSDNDAKKSFTHLITEFRKAENSMPVARTAAKGLIMPSKKFYHYLTVTKGLVTSSEIQAAVDEERTVYHEFFHNTANFNVEFPQLTVKDKLDCMENFDRVEPLSVKCGEIIAKCTCRDSYRSLCCVESIVFSMLFNTELVVPSTERDTPLKQKPKEKVNPFNAAAVRKKKAVREAKVIEPKWAPTIPTCSAVLPSNAANVCAGKGSTRQISAKASVILLSLCRRR